MTAPAEVPTCPRCQRRGVRTHDEWVCFDHGTFVTPRRPWDLAVFDQADGLELKESLGREKAGKRGGSMHVTPWTERELAEWDSWQEGDPLPEWAGGDGTRKTGPRSRRSPRSYSAGGQSWW